jgi:gamma-glutamyltranspeptidase / glutathione hydrolase / leukotriene-C4 hydrolase
MFASNVVAPKFYFILHEILQQVIDGLEKIGHKTKRYRDRGSIICAIVKLLDGYIYANADHRKGGEVYGIDD